MLGFTIHYRIGELHNIQAWIIREDFSNEVTFTLRPEDKAEVTRVKSRRGLCQEGQECVKSQR